MYSKAATIIVVFITSLLMSSCSNSINDLDETAFEIAEKKQSSENVKDLRITVLVKDAHLGKYLYKIEIFDSNPEIASASNLKTGYGSRDIYYAATLAIPQSTKTLYVRQTDPNKNQTLKVVEINNTTTLMCDFN
jgi:hypothetical protein